MNKFNEWMEIAFARFQRVAGQLQRGKGHGKHADGHRAKQNHRAQLKASRKRKREAHKRARRIAAGRKHVR